MLDPADIATVAREGASGLRLAGRKVFVAGAEGADRFLVSARLGDGHVLCLVPATAPGLSCAVRHAVDGSASGTLVLSGCATTASPELS